MGIILGLIAVISVYYYSIFNSNIDKNHKIVRNYDIDGDGVKEIIVLENRKTETSGDVYLSVNEAEHLVYKDYNDPLYELYSLELDFLKFDGYELIFVNLSQFTNGIGNSVESYLFSFAENEIEKKWAASEFSRFDEQIIRSNYDGEYIRFYDELEKEFSKIHKDELEEDIVKIISEDTNLLREKYEVSLPISSKSKMVDGKTHIIVERVVYNNVFRGIYIEEYEWSSGEMRLKKNHIITK